jgi:hypothetical protein
MITLLVTLSLIREGVNIFTFLSVLLVKICRHFVGVLFGNKFTSPYVIECRLLITGGNSKIKINASVYGQWLQL